MGHQKGCGSEEKQLQEKSGSVLSDERMGEEWQPGQPRCRIYYILVSFLFVISLLLKDSRQCNL